MLPCGGNFGVIALIELRIDPEVLTVSQTLSQIRAAAMLGLNRNTLRKKIRLLEIPVSRGLG